VTLPAVESQALILVQRARAALAEAKTLPEIRKVREWAGVAADAARRAYKLGEAQELRAAAHGAELDAHELRIEAYRREGEMLRDMADSGERAGVGRPAGNADTLSAFGYDRDGQDFKRAMQVAAIPEPVVREYMIERRTVSEPASYAGLIRHAADAGKRRSGATPSLPDGVFRTLVIDPPWPMGHSARIDTPEQGSRLDYPAQPLSWIQSLEVPEVAADAAHVYLWVTQRFLPDGLRLIKEWGLTYHCLLTWIKPGGFAPFSWMFNAEHAIFAYRGAFELQRQGLKIAFSAPTQGHSVKPDEFYALVEQVSFEPRLDMFARRQRPGWTAWGDEVST
jgi:N6-adenosine-specific RNA methylase IME4